MYPYKYIIPNNSSNMYRNTGSLQYTKGQNMQGDDRFFLTPFLVGGLAGTALGYGIANNNQINRPQCCQFYPVYYPQQVPIYSNTNFYY